MTLCLLRFVKRHLILEQQVLNLSSYLMHSTYLFVMISVCVCGCVVEVGSNEQRQVESWSLKSLVVRGLVIEMTIFSRVEGMATRATAEGIWTSSGDSEMCHVYHWLMAVVHYISPFLCEISPIMMIVFKNNYEK